MSLPMRQLRVLTYLAGRDTASARDIAADLRMNRTDAENALRLLAGRNLAAAGPAAYPTTFAITGQGRAFLAELAQEA